MATARSTTNSDIHSQLNGYVTDYLTKHMYDANTSWPLRKTIRLPKQAELEAHYTHIRAQDEAIRNWAQQHHCETSEKTKIISNGIVRQTSQLIDSVTIPDLNTALNITTPQTRKLYQREHQRAHTITNQFNLDSNTSINIAKILKNHDDTDFNLVIQTAHYFANHNTENMTPRMVPIPGFSAKWLGKTTSNRCKAICKLLKREQLALNDRHGEIRLRLLDTQHHNDVEHDTIPVSKLFSARPSKPIIVALPDSSDMPEQQAEKTHEQRNEIAEQSGTNPIQPEEAAQRADDERFRPHNTEQPQIVSEPTPDETSVFKPAFEPGSVFDRVAKGELAKQEQTIEVDGLTSDDAKRTDDFTVQFEMARHPELLPFLAMNPSLYDDLYAWLGALGNADIDAALSHNPGYAEYRKAVGK